MNRAGDDAAGLAISEKMRGQIRGLNMASKNAQDGISLIQTAEGGLNETHAILQRMRELAVQSANDTNVEIDRGAIQDEMNQLVAELDRISDTTEFNTQGLLDGGFKGKFQIGANEGQNVELQIGKMNSTSLGLVTTNSIENGDTANALLADGIYTLDGTNIKDTKGNVVATFDSDNNAIKVDDTVVVTLEKAALANGAQITISDKGAKFDVKNTLAEADGTNNLGELAPGKYEIKDTSVIKDGKLIGKLETNVITLENGKKIKEADLGFQEGKLKDGVSFTINGSDVSTRSAAEGSITTINKAIEKVSTERSKLGAMQNRLEHTIKNLDTSAENLQAAESRIRDVDMAKEMMEFTKQNILQQASTAMLAQANSLPQGVLQLLR
ncbi:hypothetical protein L0P56_06195 [Anaerosalibacter bizertensis]|nr:hypothetical protein [Anaerosalibacter bizertensis]